jgi:hypothetical protein
MGVVGGNVHRNRALLRELAHALVAQTGVQPRGRPCVGRGRSPLGRLEGSEVELGASRAFRHQVGEEGPGDGLEGCE